MTQSRRWEIPTDGMSADGRGNPIELLENWTSTHWLTLRQPCTTYGSDVIHHAELNLDQARALRNALQSWIATQEGTEG